MSDEKSKNFWMTLNLLVGMDWKKNTMEDVEDWLESVEANRKTVTFSEPNVVARITPVSTSGRSSPSSNKSRKGSAKSQKRELQLPKVECSFRHPKIRSRLERLMGSNLVRLTDRRFMIQLHDRILEDYIQTMNRRIAAREARERDREKDLVLSGRIPFDQAPKEMANHPVLLINAYCEQLIAERRAKIKVPRVYIPLTLYVDDTPDPPYGLTISEGHVFRSIEDRICTPPELHLNFTTEDDVERGYMFSADEFEKKQKYEDPLVKSMADVETVEEMYALADEIIGPLKTIKQNRPAPTEETTAAAV